jgi:hypothetical protein
MTNPIVKVLMERDGFTKADAYNLFYDVRNRIMESIDDPNEVEEIMMEEFGLEMDYIMDII